MKVKLLKIEDVVFGFLVFSVLINSYTYFVWDAYGNALIKYTIKSLRYFGLLLMLFYIIHRKGLSNAVSKNVFLLGVVLFLTLFQMDFLGALYTKPFNIGSLVTFTTFGICFSLDFEQRSKLYEIFMKLFALVTIPSVIYFLLVNIFSINLPYTVLASDHPGKVAQGVYYELRPLGLILTSTYFSSPRLCGIFDEPGVIGTLAAFLVAANVCCSKDKKWTYLLIFEGIMSFSMAFYALMVILCFVYAFTKSKIKFIALSIAALISLGIFVNMEFDNIHIKRIQNRIDFTSDILIKNNRTTVSFDKAFEDFVSKGGYSLVFGEGIGAYNENPNMTGSNSYKCIIYNHGIIGFILFIGFFVLIYTLEYGIHSYNIAFFVVFMASIYQRFGVLNSLHLILFTTGLAYIALNKDESILEKKRIIKDNGDKYANHQIRISTTR